MYVYVLHTLKFIYLLYIIHTYIHVYSMSPSSNKFNNFNNFNIDKHLSSKYIYNSPSPQFNSLVISFLHLLVVSSVVALLCSLAISDSVVCFVCCGCLKPFHYSPTLIQFPPFGIAFLHPLLLLGIFQRGCPTAARTA